MGKIILSIVSILIFCMLLSCCDDNSNYPSEQSSELLEKDLPIKIAKWHNNHSAAISLTYDAGGIQNGTFRSRVREEASNHNIPISYELVTSDLTQEHINFIYEHMIPEGFSYFGHGHWHFYHDDLTFEDAYESFKLFYDTMKSIGLKPVAYAYPHGSGYDKTTRKALAEAGFLSGRLHDSYDIESKLLIPDEEIEPEDWFLLPTLVMQSYDFQQNDIPVNNTEELIIVLDETIERKAWIIPTYHNIGWTSGWGFYYMEDFLADLDAIQERDFWVASFNDVTLYVREKARAEVYASAFYNEEDLNVKEIKINISDYLENDQYDHPLTLLFDVPDEWLNHRIGIYQDEELIENTIFEKPEGMVSLKPNEMSYTLKPMFF